MVVLVCLGLIQTQNTNSKKDEALYAMDRVSFLRHSSNTISIKKAVLKLSMLLIINRRDGEGSDLGLVPGH